MKWVLHVLSVLTAVMCSCNKPENSEVSGNQSGAGQVPDNFIILAWSDIISASNAEWKLQKMMEAGFNTYLGWFDTLAEVDMLLSAADKVGIGIITDSPELRTNPKEAVAVMNGHESLFGYHIDDEPEVSEFSSLATRIKAIETYDKAHPCYVNLYPNWAWGGEDVYLSRVRAFLKNVPVEFLSFDNYPVKTVDGVSAVRPDWYHNLEDIRTAARESGIPFWGFALALSHKTPEASYPVPTIGELRLQQFSNLVYGAVGFQYFTTWGFIQNNGVVENVYNKVKQVNAELLSMESLFLGADVSDVWHTGAVIPTGTSRLTSLPAGVASLETSAAGAVVSYFVKDGRYYLAVVNKDCNADMDLRISFTADAMVSDDHNMSWRAVGQSAAGYKVSAGDIILFSL